MTGAFALKSGLGKQPLNSGGRNRFRTNDPSDWRRINRKGARQCERTAEAQQSGYKEGKLGFGGNAHISNQEPRKSS